MPENTVGRPKRKRPASLGKDGITPYLLSLPERLVRSATALAGGLVRELGDVALPPAIRRTRVYQTLVEGTLRFLVEQVGQVEGVYSGEGQPAGDFLLRRTAGNGIELFGILAFRASPVWVMAALADLSGAGKQLIVEISESMKKEGLLEPDTRFETVEQMLDGLERSAGRLAQSFNTPPLDVAGLREEWQELRDAVRSIPPRNLPSPDLIWRNWEALKAEAAAQDRSIFAVSTLMAISAISRIPENLLWLSRSARHAALRTGQMFAGALLDHYADTLREIRDQGFLGYWMREFRPYLRAAASHFSPRRVSLTQKMLRRATD